MRPGRAPSESSTATGGFWSFSTSGSSFETCSCCWSSSFLMRSAQLSMSCPLRSIAQDRPSRGRSRPPCCRCAGSAGRRRSSRSRGAAPRVRHRCRPPARLPTRRRRTIRRRRVAPHGRTPRAAWRRRRRTATRGRSRPSRPRPRRHRRSWNAAARAGHRRGRQVRRGRRRWRGRRRSGRALPRSGRTPRPAGRGRRPSGPSTSAPPTRRCRGRRGRRSTSSGSRPRRGRPRRRRRRRRPA